MERLLRYCLIHYTGLDAHEAETLDVDTAAARLVAFAAPRCARTAASYMVAGFVHGVLNTDNINITGESFDYGPWRFTPTWDPAFTAAYFDHGGLYAFGRQPQAIHWNVGQLAVSLRTIAAAEPLVEALESFAPAYEAALAERFCWRLGVEQGSAEQDKALVIAAERLMRASEVLIDDFYADWAGGRTPEGADSPERSALIDALSGRSATRSDWTAITTPQSLHIEEVEALWAPIAEADNWQPVLTKIAAIRAMGTALATAS